MSKTMARRSSRGKPGAASAAPALIREQQELAEADQWEADALDAIEAVQDPDEAESLLRKVTTVAQAMRLNKISGDREWRWRVLRLRAERRYGELLGPAEEQPRTAPGKRVTPSHVLEDAERKVRHRARQVAAVPAERFEEYVGNSEEPSHRGLLRNTGRKRRRGGEGTVKPSTSSRSVAHSVEVLNWVRRQLRAGLQSQEIVEASRSDEHWPAPGEPLTDRTLSACQCSIYHLEQQGARWPLRQGGTALRNGKRVGKRLHQVGSARAAARRNGDPVVLWDTAYDVTKLTGLLQSLNIEDAELDEHGLDLLNDLHDDMLYLQDWSELLIAALQGRLGEQGLRQKIAALRSKTVANGCTLEEAEAAARMADRLERRLTLALTATG